jgi:hypothetical protein
MPSADFEAVLHALGPRRSIDQNSICSDNIKCLICDHVCCTTLRRRQCVGGDAELAAAFVAPFAILIHCHRFYRSTIL